MSNAFLLLLLLPLCNAGVLPGLAVSLPAIIRQATKQQQQQLSTGHWRLFNHIMEMMRNIVKMWDSLAGSAPQMLRIIQPAVLPLLQHLQAAGALLPAVLADCSTGGGSSNHNSSSSSSTCKRGPFHGFLQVQCMAMLLLRAIAELVEGRPAGTRPAAHLTPEGKLLREPAVSQLLLQLLTVSAVILHRDHATYRQQQRASAASCSSSSSGQQPGSQAAASGAKQQHRADLLLIPAFHQHQDMLQLLPGGQAYLDAVPEWFKARWHRGNSSAEVEAERTNGIAHQTHALTQLMTVHLRYLVEAEQGRGPEDSSSSRTSAVSEDPVLSAAAVRLVLELQLLAASWLQRRRSAPQQQQQQQQGAEQEQDVVEVFLLQCNELLQVQIRAFLQTSRCLPPEVLQQAGLQLLQALAAPLQQLQMSHPEGALVNLPGAWIGVPIQQLLALRAAAAGVFKAQAGTLGKCPLSTAFCARLLAVQCILVCCGCARHNP
jgi:hypothetical protein